MVAGFVVGGSTSATVLVRGIGPGLATLGVSGTLADPSFQVFNAAGAVVAANDNWGGDPDRVSAVGAQVGAFPLANPASLDSALVLSLAPGAYTVNVTGAGNSAGQALVEVYAVP